MNSHTAFFHSGGMIIQILAQVMAVLSLYVVTCILEIACSVPLYCVHLIEIIFYNNIFQMFLPP